jgi:mannosyltransferase
MSTAPTLPSPRPVARVAGAGAARARRLVPSLEVLLTVAVALGVLARLHSPSALWLDEALSVGIARRPVPELFEALRRDGSPPLYYLLLHAWTGAFGTSDVAVRALSTVVSLGALPLVWLAGRRLGGPPTARAALLLLAVSPFAVRYATETRMYALVQLLVAAGLLLLLRALERPTTARLLPVSVVAGLLALTHYWALFLLAATAALLLALALKGSRPARRALAALAGGGLLFLPWLPTFLFQVRRTGTPWAPTPHLVDVWYTVTAWSGGGGGPGVVLSLLVAALALLAVVGHDEQGRVVIGGRPDRTALLLVGGCVGTLVLGLVVGMVVGAGYAPRYSSVALVPGLLLAALGLRALPQRARTAALVVVAVAGLMTSLPQLSSTRRSQAEVTAAALQRTLVPGDVVAYCPDQLGPAVSRLLPEGTDQVVYPTGGDPELVDWVDYAERNADASPAAFANALSTRTDGAVLLVSAGGYLTFGRQCDELGEALERLRGPGVAVKRQSGRFDEQQAVTRYPAAAPTG